MLDEGDGARVHIAAFDADRPNQESVDGWVDDLHYGANSVGCAANKLRSAMGNDSTH